MIPAGVSGKIKTGAQIVAISLLIIYNKLGEFSHLAPISLWVAVVVTLASLPRETPTTAPATGAQEATRPGLAPAGAARPAQVGEIADPT